MNKWLGFLYGLLSGLCCAAPHFEHVNPSFKGTYLIDGAALCATAKHTLAYLNKGTEYDPQVIHDGKVIKIPLKRVKATLVFICKHQDKLNNPEFVRQHFEFIRWYPDKAQALRLSAKKPLLQRLPDQKILMTKYFVHKAKASPLKNSNSPFALYGLPEEEQHLTLEEANSRPGLTRFKYGKQAILRGALQHQKVPALAYFSREDLETTLLQGTVVADFGPSRGKKIFNVHRNNNIPYDRTLSPYAQERYWYFKEVDGIKGYGKDAEHKITVDPETTFAADLEQLGLGKLLLVQYPNQQGALVSRAGILADTGGAFANNLYQVDYLAGSFSGNADFIKASGHLPDYINAYFMVLKSSQ